jgi:hypothetical protein
MEVSAAPGTTLVDVLGGSVRHVVPADRRLMLTLEPRSALILVPEAQLVPEG